MPCVQKPLAQYRNTDINSHTRGTYPKFSSNVSTQRSVRDHTLEESKMKVLTVTDVGVLGSRDTEGKRTNNIGTGTRNE